MAAKPKLHMFIFLLCKVFFLVNFRFPIEPDYGSLLQFLCLFLSRSCFYYYLAVVIRSTLGEEVLSIILRLRNFFLQRTSK